MERTEYQKQQDADVESVKRVAAKYELMLASAATSSFLRQPLIVQHFKDEQDATAC